MYVMTMKEFIQDTIKRLTTDGHLTMEEINLIRKKSGYLPLEIPKAVVESLADICRETRYPAIRYDREVERRIKQGPIHAPQCMVEDYPEIFVDPECLPACKELWEKNIYTYTTSEPADGDGGAWIEIETIALEDDNMCYLVEAIAEVEGAMILHSPHPGHIRIFVKGDNGEEKRDRLLDVAERLQMQDVRPGVAYEEVPALAEFGLIVSDCRVYNSEFDHAKHLAFEEYMKTIKGQL
jgi:hypothetical protein